LRGKRRLFLRVSAKPQQIAHVARGAAGADNIYRLSHPVWDNVRIALPLLRA
jgi:hypothetical protein